MSPLCKHVNVAEAKAEFLRSEGDRFLRALDTVQGNDCGTRAMDQARLRAQEAVFWGVKSIFST
jgi:hypothetical protein